MTLKEQVKQLKAKVAELEADIEGARNILREVDGMVGAEGMSATDMVRFKATDHNQDMKEMRRKIASELKLDALAEDNLSNSASIAVDHIIGRFRSMMEELQIYCNAIQHVASGHNYDRIDLTGRSKDVAIVFHMALRGILARRGMDRIDYDKDDL